MCGIAGILSTTDDVFVPDLRRMNDSLLHRGPDSEGLWTDMEAGIGLAHRRLAVVDISDAGHQPMISPSGRFVLSYNGEIYNHLELRSELEVARSDLRWRGHSDTETLVVAIDTWGLRATVDKLVGMFAFALWDREERVLQLCRDRVGEKPLYYGSVRGRSADTGVTVNRFVFTSELKALSIPGFERKVSKDALVLYFRYHYIPAPYSIYEGVYKLEPGCIASIRPGALEPDIFQYWSPVSTLLAAQSSPFEGSMREATDEVERILRRAVEGQMIADVPVGAFLSGGIDSSTTVALMQQVQSSSRVNTFSIGFNDSSFDEAPYARKVAEILGTNHTELYLSDTDVQKLIQQLPEVLDEPFADSSLLPTFAVSQLARQSVTVSLSGDGGDELFGGYTRYPTTAQAIRARMRLGSVGKRIARGVLNSSLIDMDRTGRPVWPLNMNRFSSMRKIGAAVHAFAQSTDALVYRNQVSFWRNPCTPVVDPSDPICKFRRPDCWMTSEFVQDSVQMMDVQTFLPDDILYKVDRAAMGVSLETRVPMLDHRFMEFVWSLPFEYRSASAVSGGVQKKILKDIVCRSVPRENIERPKKGFGVPIGKWIRGPLSSWAESLIEPGVLESQGLLDPDIVSSCWQSVKSSPDTEAEFIWSILVLQQWLDSERPSV